MIGLLIQDNQYEQDIRELLMSFYPGEAYVHEVKDGADFYVETRLGRRRGFRLYMGKCGRPGGLRRG